MDNENNKQGGSKTLIIVAVILVLVLAGAAVGLRFFAPGLIPGWGTKPGEQGAGESGSDQGSGLGMLYPMKPFIVNLIDPSGRRYLKATLSLELSGPLVKNEIDQRLPQIQDAILVLLSSKTFDDINTIQGKDRLRSEIMNRCNVFITTGQIKNVYFSEFVVQ